MHSHLIGATEHRTFAPQRDRRRIIDRLIEELHGRFVGSAGNNVLAEFASAVDSVSGMLNTQASL